MAGDDCLSPEEKQNIPQLETNTTDESLNYNISNFNLKKILHNNTNRKSIALLGTFPDISDVEQALIIFEKRPFSEDEVQTNGFNSTPHTSDEETNEVPETGRNLSYFTDDLKIETQFINDIYGSFQVTPHADLNGVKTTVIYPATDKHVAKYSICQKYLISETSHWYENITLPYLKSSQFSLEWVYNILEHKQETDRIVYEDTDPDVGFVLLPDLKWDGKKLENLYLLAIAHQHNIKSLRDLRSEHLPLLRNIRSKSSEAIMQKYGMKSTELRMYLHYQPSFYHLHVHINPIRNDAPGIWCEKSHMLDTVINNIELMPDYYIKATIPFVLYEGHSLLDKYEEEMSVRKNIKMDNTNESMSVN